MKKPRFYSEDELIQKYQDGKIDMLFFVMHHSKQWRKLFAKFCEDNDLPQDNISAEVFYETRADALERATNLLPLS